MKIKNKFDADIFVYPSILAVERENCLHTDTRHAFEMVRSFFESIRDYALPTVDRWTNAEQCMYKGNNGITIGADGKIYKCYSVVEDKKLAVCDLTLFDVEKMAGSGSLCDRNDCPYYEYCFGGCPYNEYINKGKMQRDCQYNLLDFVNKLLFANELVAETGMSFEKIVSGIEVVNIKNE